MHYSIQTIALQIVSDIELHSFSLVFLLTISFLGDSNQTVI